MHAANQSFGWIPFLELTIAGIFLGLYYVYTRNLVFSIALHFRWNFFQGTVFGFKVSGTDNYSIIQPGSFGFEGSVLSIIFQMITIVLIYSNFARRGKLKKRIGN